MAGLIRLLWSATCGRCDWTAEGPGSDLAARHHEAETNHPTCTHAVPDLRPE